VSCRKATRGPIKPIFDLFLASFFPQVGAASDLECSKWSVRRDSKCQASGFVHHSSSFFLQQQSKNFAIAAMAQPSRADGRGKNKGRDLPTNVVPVDFNDKNQRT
jgi:hypothetical protein